MDPDAQRLARLLDAFVVAGPEHQAFMRRLTSAEGWSSTFAACAVTEYKRFLLLKVLFDGQVSPSRSVDTVWHHHLLHTRDYWGALCRDTIGRDLHHEPATAPPADPAALEARYRATLGLYRQTFGEDPPVAIWEDWAARAAHVRMSKRSRWATYAVVLVASFLAFFAGARLLQPHKDYASFALAMVAFVMIAGRWLALGLARELRTGPVGDVSNLSV